MIELTDKGKLHVMEYLLHGQTTMVRERITIHYSVNPVPQVINKKIAINNLLEHLQESDQTIGLFRQEIRIYDTKKRLLGSLLSEVNDRGLYGDTTNR
jgi:hypothetical protein